MEAAKDLPSKNYDVDEMDDVTRLFTSNFFLHETASLKLLIFLLAPFLISSKTHKDIRNSFSKWALLGL
jgi:hypothetical protein